MKALKYTVLIAALTSGLALTAKADLILSPFGDIPKNGTGIGGGNSNNQANNFFRLQNYIAAHPTFGSLGTPPSLMALKDSKPISTSQSISRASATRLSTMAPAREELPGEESHSSRSRTI